MENTQDLSRLLVVRLPRRLPTPASAVTARPGAGASMGPSSYSSPSSAPPASSVMAISLPQGKTAATVRGRRSGGTLARWPHEPQYPPAGDRGSAHQLCRTGGYTDSGGSQSRRTRDHRDRRPLPGGPDRKSTPLNSSHVRISYAVFCLKKKKIKTK